MLLNYSKIWESPTLMTWLSYLTRALSLLVVLPMILMKFTEAEISVWYLFSSVIALSSLLDFGFRTTFVRIISFAMGGAKQVGIFDGNTIINGRSNWYLIEKIFSVMKSIYFWLSIVVFIFMLTFGTWSMKRPVSLLIIEKQAWIAWGVIIFSTVIKFYGTIYQNYLEGLNKVALVRKTESIISTGLIFLSIIVLYCDGGILQLIIVFQGFSLLNFLANFFIARRIEDKRLIRFSKIPFNKDFFLQIWRPAWRSGISGLMSIGLTNLSGVLYAQIGSVHLVAGYLLALRIINQVKEVSLAPFYSKIPLMSRLRVEGNKKELISIAKKGMLISHSVFILSVIFVSIFSSYILELINSNVSFVTKDFWILLSFAFFVHRYGAMHMQLYLTTNDVKSHIADGISGLVFILVSYLLIRDFDIYAFPIGMIAGYLGFYAIYSAKLSLKNLALNFFNFELKALIFPLLIFALYVLYFLITKKTNYEI